MSSASSLPHSYLHLIKGIAAFYESCFSGILNLITLAFLTMLKMELCLNQKEEETDVMFALTAKEIDLNSTGLVG